MEELITDLDFHEMDFENMTEEELAKFRAQFNPDEMGSDEIEGGSEE